MFTNCNCCCMNNWYVPNQAPYLQITNKTSYAIFFVLQYTLDQRTITIKSNILRFHKTQKLLFPINSTNICYNILRATRPNPTFLFNGTIVHLIPTCLELLETPTEIKCVPVHC